MSQIPTLKKPDPLTTAIIADMKPGDERGRARRHRVTEEGAWARTSDVGRKSLIWLLATAP